MCMAETGKMRSSGACSPTKGASRFSARKVKASVCALTGASIPERHGERSLVSDTLINVQLRPRPPGPPRAFLTASEACQKLDVKRETLYAYASRGSIRTAKAAPPARGKLYLREDVERLEKRAGARRGHHAVAGAALDWGEPVLDSHITAIDVRGPRYRGYLALELVERRYPFEAVVELLRTGELPTDAKTGTSLAPHALRALPNGLDPKLSDPIARATDLVLRLAAEKPGACGEEERTGDRLHALMPWIVRPSGFAKAASKTSMAERILVTLGRTPSTARRDLVDAALVLVADHELNVSAFTARVVASSGASDLAVLAASLQALSGAAHGGICSRIEAMVREVDDTSNARAYVKQAAARRDELPGFGHPLYPDGDPRTPPLLDRARALAPESGPLATLDAIERAARDELGLLPTVDLGLVAASYALGAPLGTATALFAIGRTAGWLAHVDEQRRAGYLLRPRARYVGPRARELPGSPER